MDPSQREGSRWAKSSANSSASMSIESRSRSRSRSPPPPRQGHQENRGATIGAGGPIRKVVNWGKSSADKKAEVKHRNRRLVAEEILSTEATYVKTLDVIIHRFQKPLLQAIAKGKPILPRDEVQELFSDIATMRDLNQKFLSDMESLIQHYTINTTLGDTLLDFVPYFRMYRKYVENAESEKVRDIIKRLESKRKSKFKQFCQKVCKESKCLPLPALLITPVQRIPRYRLLVQEYIKNTNEHHPDYGKLETALERIKETANFVNESIKKRHSREKVIELMQLFKKDPGFVSPSRIYKFDGTLTKKSTRAEDRTYRFFLFNDMLAYAHGTKPGTFRLHKKIPLDAAFEVHDVLDGKAKEKNSFQIINSVKSFQVFSSSAKGKEEWMAMLREVTEQWKELKLKMEKRKNHMAVPQTEKKPNCQRQFKKNGRPCHRQFGMFTKRHWCYACGILCCSSCSPYNVYVNSGEKDKNRICTKCIRALMDIPENKKLYRLRDLPPAPREVSSPPAARH
mmetsp:Transcript_13411/g.21937  ORF Transcript_13411/g.21937 Transcript_13411/m.21937 type:complete len:511 (-) Transcript_13411:359-1891(-)